MGMYTPPRMLTTCQKPAKLISTKWLMGRPVSSLKVLTASAGPP
jgi:hypothetical protein